ncbi:NAD(P)/FAD-dependent oxidoreductase [uncultured Cohaesibacter sp.]|uniref:FAD/NAD(P)-dependent oxidoreductase n=1 Tax=uncultured Cohaesibacter sp. TaxID=1002546 RepID=UPI002AAC2FFB|nr:NAD(P)/FAD-dependent oxidoreductase [uncultured Cohaesibacter sp.]
MLETELAIIGAGPAGMAAASEAANCGIASVLIDEQQSVGGQIYRDVERVAPLRGALLGQDFLDGLPLAERAHDPLITHLAGAVVWQVEKDGTITCSVKNQARQIKAQRILIATGAIERPMPLPGWTLPGVMTVGAGQILLKQSGLIPNKAVLIGSGPLLYVLASQMLKAKTPPLAIIETQTMGDLTKAMAHIGGALRGWRYLLKGTKLLAALKQGGVKRYTGAHNIRLQGEGAVASVSFQCGARSHSIACDTALLHHGVVPNAQISRALQLNHHWDEQQACFSPSLDEWGKSSAETIFIAGDGAGIGGAKAAALCGRIAALKMAAELGKLDEANLQQRAAPLKSALSKETAARPFLDQAYPPFAGAQSPQDETVVCRCEEVTAGEIRKTIALGCQGPNQLKTFLRAGMGPCQGRGCGLTISTLFAEQTGKSMQEIDYFNIRSPLKPITLGELASLKQKDVERLF